MRSCENFEMMIHLYLDGMLPSGDVQKLREHMDRCEACRTRYQQFSAMQRELRDWDEPTPPELHRRIMAYVDQQGPVPAKNQRKAKNRILRFAVGAAGIAACALLAVTAIRFPLGDSGSGSADLAEPAALRSFESPSIAGVTWDPENDSPEEPQMDETVGQENGDLADRSTAGIPMTPFYGNAAEPDDPSNYKMSVDLPPVSGSSPIQNSNSMKYRDAKSYLAVTGSFDSLPEWVTQNEFFQREIDGQVRDCLDISSMAEDYWVDQLSSCGFDIQTMPCEVPWSGGGRILLVFFWE